MSEDALVARQQAQDLLRALAEERKRADSRLHQARADLRAVVLAAVEGIEAFAGVAQALEESLPALSPRTLVTAAQGAWERLELAGVVRDGAVGEPLDAARHKAVKRRASEGALPNTVVQVLRPGIVFAGERLRDAVVVVSKAERNHAPNRD